MKHGETEHATAVMIGFGHNDMETTVTMTCLYHVSIPGIPVSCSIYCFFERILKQYWSSSKCVNEHQMF